METLIERIKSIVCVKASSNRDFAIKCGIEQKTFNNYMNGRCPNTESIIKILRSFPDVSAEWLLRGNGTMLLEGAGASVNIDLRHQNQGDFSAMDNGTVNVGDMEAANKAKTISILEKIIGSNNVSAESMDKAIKILGSLYE